MIRELDRKIYQVGHYISGVYENQDGLSVEKSLMQEMKVKIKGRGLMSIILRYENVSHFRFHCGRMGHAAVNCGEGGSNEQGICFSEEFRAPPPPPCRTREIFVQQASTHVVRQCFQAKGQGTSTPYKRQGV
jgi:hypothetical protein